MKKILKAISTCSIILACMLLLVTSKISATNYKVSPAEGLNVRASAGVSGQWLGALTVGDVVDVKEMSLENAWGKINGRDGWVCMKYLKHVSAQTYRVDPSEGLNVRSGPGTSYGLLGAISIGTNVDITKICDIWGKISYEGREGWICLDYAEPVESAPMSMPTPAKSTGSFSASDEIIDFIKVSEGYEESVSEDDLVPGVSQIGYGHVVQSGEKFSSMTRAQAHDLLVKDLNGYYGRAINIFLQGNHIIATKEQFDALLSFTYNLGIGWMKNNSKWDDFRNFIVKAKDKNLSNIDERAFAAEVLQYHHASGKCELGLLYRRIDEMNIFFHGDYTRHYGSNPYDYPIPDCIRAKWDKR